MAEKYLWVGTKSLNSGGNIDSTKKKRKNPLIRIDVNKREDVVTLFKLGIVESFQSSASEQEIVARIILVPSTVPPIAIK